MSLKHLLPLTSRWHLPDCDLAHRGLYKENYTMLFGTTWQDSNDS